MGSLLLATADEVGLPADPEFRAALAGYLEWGGRRARGRPAGSRRGWGSARPGTGN
ncbi:hypothetical protein [Amycolatopsis sp. GA6-003]|uniref:hypothetical protein n=1 Tax=Amycolatopsis sp. GA6-003 TaxID=2652444 RepID=UPI003916FC9F